MNTEIKKLKELGAPDWYLAFLETGLPSCRMNASDAVGPMVLSWKHAQAVNKRLANLVEKQDRDYEALKDRWNKQVAHGVKLAGDLSSKNAWNLKLLKENERLRDANKQLHTLNPLSDKECIGALKGVPLFTHKDIQQAARATLGEIAHERADLERSKRDLESARSALADLESKLYNTKLDLECTQRALKAQTNLTAVAKQEVVLLRQSPKWDELRAERDEARRNERNWADRADEALCQYLECKKELEQVVNAKDAAVEQAKDWKKKYQDRKNLDFGLFCGANPFKGSTCHDEVTFSVPDAKKVMEDFKKSFPEVAGIFNTQGATTGRTQCKEPNPANAPKSPTAVLQDGVATHDDGKNSRFRNSGSAYVITEDEDTKYYWTYEPWVGGVFKLALHHTLPQRRTFQDKRADTGRMSSQKPEVQHIPPSYWRPSLRRADESTDMVDALKWAIDFGRAEQAVLGIRHAQPLTIKVPRVDTGVWLWHDKQHPSRIYQIRTMTGKVTTVVSRLGGMQYTWRVTECADGYILTLESTCTSKF